MIELDRESLLVHAKGTDRLADLEDQPGRIIDLFRNASQPMFLVCVTDQLRRVQEPVDKKPASSELGTQTAVRARVG